MHASLFRDTSAFRETLQTCALKTEKLQLCYLEEMCQRQSLVNIFLHFKNLFCHLYFS